MAELKMCNLAVIKVKELEAGLHKVLNRNLDSIDSAPFSSDADRLLAKSEAARLHLELLMLLKNCSPTSAEVAEMLNSMLDEEEPDEWKDLLA